MSNRNGFRLKRPKRPRRDRHEKANHSEVLRELLSFPLLHRWAAEIDDTNTAVLGGRPADHPAIVKLLFGIMAWEWGGQRGAHREIRDPATWAVISKALRPLYPDCKCFEPGGKPVTRFQYARFRDRHGIDETTFQTFLLIALEDACAQARSMGQLVDGCGGSISRPNRNRICSGDGTVLTPLYSATPGDLQLNPVTGKPEQVRHDPDAGWYETGDGRRVRGHNFVLLESRCEHEDEIILLGVVHQPKNHPGGEGAIAIDMIRRVRPHLPGLQAITWDKVLRGKHIEELYDLGLQPIVKVAKAKGGGLKSRRIGTHKVTGATADKVEVYARAGSIGIEVPVGGRSEFVRCVQTKLMMRPRCDGICWYADYRIPAAAPIPAGLRNGKIRVRLNGTSKLDPPGLNRAEVIRPVAEADPEWKPLYGRRPCSESTNSWFKARLPKRRSPALGAKRISFEMLCLQVFANVRALIAYKRRNGIPPPTN